MSVNVVNVQVNILTHATEVSPVDDIKTRLGSKRDRDGNIIECRGYRGDTRETVGALWDIFRREDVKSLEKYLLKHSKEFQKGFSVVKVCLLLYFISLSLIQHLFTSFLYLLMLEWFV